MKKIILALAIATTAGLAFAQVTTPRRVTVQTRPPTEFKADTVTRQSAPGVAARALRMPAAAAEIRARPLTSADRVQIAQRLLAQPVPPTLDTSVALSIAHPTTPSGAYILLAGATVRFNTGQASLSPPDDNADPLVMFVFSMAPGSILVDCEVGSVHIETLDWSYYLDNGERIHSSTPINDGKRIMFVVQATNESQQSVALSSDNPSEGWSIKGCTFTRLK